MVGISFTQSLETSRILQERLASAPANEKRTALEQKIAQADFATFGMFKHALSQMGPALSAATRGLGWGVGLGAPALGVGHLLARDTRQQGEKLVDHTRNQALLTALGVTGMQGVGQAVGSALKSRSAAPPVTAPAAPTPTSTAPEPPVQQPQTHERSMTRPGLDVQELAALRGYPGLENLQGFEGLEGLPGFERYKTSSDSVLQKLAAVILLDNVLEQQISKLAEDERADAIECLFLNRSHGARLLRELY